LTQVACGSCGLNAEHASQVRMFTCPNVLFVQVQRIPGVPRVPVHPEEHLDLPGCPPLRLDAVVYHAGRSVANSGHYTCACRDTAGRFRFYDDARPVVPVDRDIGQVKPLEIYLLLYSRLDGRVIFTEDVAPMDGVVADVIDIDGAIPDLPQPSGVSAPAAPSVVVPPPGGRTGGVSGATLGSRVLARRRVLSKTPSREVLPVGAAQGAGVASACAQSSGHPTAPRQSLLKRVREHGPDAAPALVPMQQPLASGAVLPPALVQMQQQAPAVRANRALIVHGFGSERVDDVAADEAQRIADGLARGRRRVEDGTRGRARDFQNNDLDRGAGGAWHLGR
jgi:hypothetical protein